MVLRLRTIKNPRELFTEPAPVNAIDVKHSGMCRQARPNCRNRMVFRPIDEGCQGCPIRFIRERRGARLRPSYDQSIYASRPNLTNVFIAVVAQATTPIPTPELWQKEQSQTHRYVASRRGEKGTKLKLCGPQCSARHVVHERNDDGLVICAPVLQPPR